MKKISYLFVMLLALSIKVSGQDAEQDLFDLSLEELMNIEIVSASKKAESSFESPLSSTVLTRDEIVASGAITIEDALRLVPGMLIREETNGNFDVHIRGNDNLPPGSFTPVSENTLTLVMIDGRQVYNFTSGGTFWETLPISLIDVERIEVIRGAATALYGPNAVTGAINIITRHAADKEISVRGSAQLGNKNTSAIDLSVGTSMLENKFKVRVSGNFENRDRDQDTYYSYDLGQYLPRDQVPDYNTGNFQDIYSSPSRAKERAGVNAFMQYDMNEQINFQFSGGLQESYASTAYQETTATPLSNRTMESNYVDFRAQAHGLSAQFSVNNGMQDLLAGTNSHTSRMDFSKLFANVEYELNFGKLIVRPGINYQEAVYTDLPHGGDHGDGFLNSEKSIANFGYFLRTDYRPIDKLRLIGAIRNDDYNTTDKTYFTYQFAGTYHFSDHQMIRAVVSRANRGSFLMDSYKNFTTGDGFTEPEISYLGSDSLHLPVIKMFEIGYRGMLSSKLTLDVEVFYTFLDDLSTLVATDLNSDVQNGTELKFKYQNIDLVSKQIGTTFSLNIVPSKKVQLRVYATIQQTNLENYDKAVAPLVMDPVNEIYTLPVTERVNVVHKQTPSIFGGVTGNFRPIDKLNVFAGLYYLGAQAYRHDYAAYDESKGEVEMPGRAIVNVKASYNIYKNNSIFINARNAFNSKGQEFGFADEIGGLYLAGITLSF